MACNYDIDALFEQRPWRGPEGTLDLCNMGKFVHPSVRPSVHLYVRLPPSSQALEAPSQALEASSQALEASYQALEAKM